MTSPVTLTFLGGLGDIGRNCAALEQDGAVLMIDCGLMFPDNDMFGVDVVLPDFTYLRERADRIVGCVATHGHEDHIGALSHLLRDLSFPVYGSALTCGLARPRIEEARLLDRTEFRVVADGERVKIGPFECEFLPVTHSVPHGFATIIHTSQGVIAHTGDFKIDLTPVDGRLTDLARFGAIASSEGIRLLLSDSTNADDPGFTRSERAVGGVLYNLMHSFAGKRIITACFASHIHRIQQIADAAIDLGRRVAPLGRSMVRNIELAREMGILKLDSRHLIDIEDVDTLPPGEVCVISTGSQGEPMSALALLGGGESRWLRAGPDDVVILSSHPIPGNEHNVSRVVDSLIRLGAEVVDSGVADVHATGHAQQEELKLLLSICRPEYFVPVHGEYRHLVHHARLARIMGVHDDKVLVAEDGDQLVLDDSGLRITGQVPSDYVFVHGATGDLHHSVLQERRVLSEEGMVSLVVCVDTERRELVRPPEVVSRGWVGEAEGAKLEAEMIERVTRNVQAALLAGSGVEDLRRTVRKAAGSFVSRSTRRRPMIVPVVLEV